MALLRAAKSLDGIKDDDDDVTTGVQIIKRSLEAPIRQIAFNAGMDASVVVQKVLTGNGEAFGFNADTGEYVDLIKAGVVDPVKVTRTALENAASIAGTILTTEALVADIPEKKPAMAGMDGHGHGGEF